MFGVKSYFTDKLCSKCVIKIKTYEWNNKCISCEKIIDRSKTREKIFSLDMFCKDCNSIINFCTICRCSG